MAPSDAVGDAGSGTGPAMEDWGLLVSFRPDVVLRPTSIDELKATLERVHRGELGDGRVRVPGSLHSCSEIVVADAILDTSTLPKSMDFEADDAAVVATANVSLHDFLAELGSRGKSVTATGGTDHQTLAGLISTGTAPASSRHALYDLLDWVELVSVDPATGQAIERRISRDDDDFAAAVCSLGLLGVLTRVRFRLVDERYFEVVMKIVDLDDVLADPEATSVEFDFWRVNWAPKSDKALLWAATAIPRERADPDGDYSTDISEHILDIVFQVIDKLSDTGPLLTEALEVIYDVMVFTYGENRASGPLRNMLPVDRRAPLRVAMAEWSFRPQDTQRVAPRVPSLLRRPRLAEHPHRDRAGRRGRKPHVGVELGRAPLGHEVQLHVPDRDLHRAGREGGHPRTPARPLGALRFHRCPAQGALGKDQLHRPRFRPEKPRLRGVSRR